MAPDRPTAVPTTPESQSQTRELRPAPPKPVVSGGPEPANLAKLVAKRRAVEIACQICRRRRTRCTGEQPSCASCEKRGVKCVYPEDINSKPPKQRIGRDDSDLGAIQSKCDELHMENSVYRELLEILRTMPEQDAHGVLRRIRSGMSVQNILNHIKDGDLLLQVHLAPNAQRRYEFPYRSTMPAALLFEGNPYLRSLVYETTFRLPGSTMIQPPRLQPDSQCIYLAPYHGAELREPRVDEARFSRWTTVSVDEGVMRTLFKAHLFLEHEMLWYFHKDLFLDDLVAGRKRFCSSLLVNALLAASCRSYERLPKRTQFWDPEALVYKFLAEARRLWEIESHRNKLTTIQAAVVMHHTNIANGTDKTSMYGLASISMAGNMGLFDDDFEMRTKEERIARERTAWVVWYTQAQQTHYFLQPPFITKPPRVPSPDPKVESEWYGELLVRYPLNQRPTAMRMGYSQKGHLDLLVILAEISERRYGAQRAAALTITDAWAFKERLDCWLDNLPDEISPSLVALPAPLKLQYVPVLKSTSNGLWRLTPACSFSMQYHCELIFLFSPLIDTSFDDDMARATPKDIVSHASKCLETVVRLYYIRHGFEAVDMFLQYFLMVLAKTSMDTIEATLQRAGESEPGSAINADQRLAPDDLETLTAARSTLFMVMKGLYHQSKHIHICTAFYRVTRENMREDEKRTLDTMVAFNEPRAEAEETQIARFEVIRSRFPMPIFNIRDTSKAQTLGRLMRAFREMSIHGSDTDGSASSRDDVPMLNLGLDGAL